MLCPQELKLRSSIRRLRGRLGEEGDIEESACKKAVSNLRRILVVLFRPAVQYLDETLPMFGTVAESRHRRVWEATIFLFVIYTVLMIPMQTAFDSQFNPSFAWGAFNVVVDAAFLLDMCGVLSDLTPALVLRRCRASASHRVPS